VLCHVAGPRKNSHTQSPIWLFNEHPSTNPTSPSHHKGFAFSTSKMMPLFKENIGFFHGFPLPSSVSALVGPYDTRAVIGWTILKYPGPNTGNPTHIANTSHNYISTT